ncbi:unnamed protein product [Brachionus calyciflorus]|uniref:Amine oxidase domain-containing protein n=1 Tax=Brachionus calyciflorus TaxID=104777 RepID=A0A814B1X6_9BILA|nr:unnamed protein product [Brachionus calyciflorus]
MSNYQSFETVIIGAGMSGISAAVNFLKNGYENFLLFEASDRIGGRIHTIDYEDGILEYGAQFIHGQVDNPIYKIAIENELIDEYYKEILYESDEDLSKHNGLKINLEEKERLNLFLNENGNKIDNNLIEIAFDCLNRSIRLAEKYSITNPLDQDLKLGFFIYENFLNLAKKFLNIKDSEVKNNLDCLFLWRCKIENVENSCNSVNDLSLKNFSNYIELKGSQIIEPKRGYKSILQQIIQNYEQKFEQKLKFKHELNKILLCENSSDCKHSKFTKDPKKIVLLFNNENVVLCEKIILTVSLGFLKENIKTLIDPISYVPLEKLEVIERQGYGTVNKIILEYETPFWDDNLETINLIWSDMDRENLFDRLDHVNFDVKKRWFEDVCSFEPSINYDNVLIGWICGNSYHESLSDEEIINECTLNLGKFFNKEIPKAKNVFRSKWNSNPLFNGSYSFYSYGSQPDDIDILARPLITENGAVIYFAGEATHPEFYSTVHGAYLSGIRESNRILENS